MAFATITRRSSARSFERKRSKRKRPAFQARNPSQYGPAASISGWIQKLRRSIKKTRFYMRANTAIVLLSRVQLFPFVVTVKRSHRRVRIIVGTRFAVMSSIIAGRRIVRSVRRPFSLASVASISSRTQLDLTACSDRGKRWLINKEPWGQRRSGGPGYRGGHDRERQRWHEYSACRGRNDPEMMTLAKRAEKYFRLPVTTWLSHGF